MTEHFTARRVLEGCAFRYRENPVDGSGAGRCRRDRQRKNLMQTDELAVLYRLTDSLYRARSVGDAYEAALDAIVAVLGSRASILLFDEAGAMRFVAWRGLSDKYRSALVGHSPWKKGDTEAHPLFIEDIDKTDEPDWIKAAIRAEGIRGLGFIPIMSRGEVIGKFMTYYPTHTPSPQRKANSRSPSRDSLALS